MSIVINGESLRYITLFETVTGANVKDCILTDDRIIFIVEEGHLKKSLGRKKENVRKIREILKKGVDIIEYSREIECFVRNIFHNYSVKEIVITGEGEGRRVSVRVDPKDKGKVIGRGGENLRIAREILKRHHYTGNIVIL